MRAVNALGTIQAAPVAEVLGYGPLPTPIAREVLAESHGRRWWRRLFTAPHGIERHDPRRARCG